MPGRPRVRRRNNPQVILRRTIPEDLHEVGTCQCDATFRRPEIICRNVQEDGASPPGNGRIVIVSQGYDQIVKRVVPPQLLVTGRMRQGYSPILKFIGRIVATAVGRWQGPSGEESLWWVAPVGSIQELAQRKAPDRRCTVTFSLFRGHTAAPEGAMEGGALVNE